MEEEEGDGNTITYITKTIGNRKRSLVEAVLHRTCQVTESHFAKI